MKEPLTERRRDPLKHHESSHYHLSPVMCDDVLSLILSAIDQISASGKPTLCIIIGYNISK
jgi:hypothetical protein